jgi:hypothetical protein
MSSRAGSIVIAITSAAVRISGDTGAADILWLAALGTLTIALHRAGDLQMARLAARAGTPRDPRTA